jgi:hypothetical protein
MLIITTSMKASQTPTRAEAQAVETTWLRNRATDILEGMTVTQYRHMSVYCRPRQ